MQLYSLDFLPLLSAALVMISVILALGGKITLCRITLLPSAALLFASLIGLRASMAAALFSALFIICASASFMRNFTTKQ